MISVVEINENNYRSVCKLMVSDEQKSFVASPVSILARAYAKRSASARALAITKDEIIIGVIMFLELSKEPSCYTIEQFLIDHLYQNKGYGKQALGLVIEILASERKFETIEICVKKDAAQALHVYKNAGFFDTGYTDPNEPDSYILKYELNKLQ
jgi:RimJ/RimL family protein N-acetyltransferase